MQYQNGSATSSTDLVQQLAAWLVGLGWTEDRSAVEGAGWTASLHNHANYVHLRAVENESGQPWHANLGSAHYGVHMYTGTGFNSGQPFNNQAGAPVSTSTYPIGVGMQLSAGPFANYYFFADSTADNIVVVVEKTSGFFVYLGWGLSIQKAGAFTGGAYFFGSTSGYYTSAVSAYANTPGLTITSDPPFVNVDGLGGGSGFVRADVDSWTGKWVGIYNATTGADQGFTGKQGDSSVRGSISTMKTNFPTYAQLAGNYNFQNEQVSAQDGRANLLPPLLWVLRDGTTTGFSLLGSPPFVFVSNAVGNGFSSGDEYVLGATTYKLFPGFAVVKQ
jgi:hypothetical protein